MISVEGESSIYAYGTYYIIPSKGALTKMVVFHIYDLIIKGGLSRGSTVYILITDYIG